MSTEVGKFIEHIIDYERYVGEINRVLKKNGVVIFTTPNAALRLDPGQKPWNPFHVREFRYEELKELLDRFYRSVEIFGLFGEEELYSIEYQRALKGKISAIEGSAFEKKSKRSGWKVFVKSKLPNRVIEVLKFFRKKLTRQAAPKNSQMKKGLSFDFIRKYSVRDFYYNKENLNDALDFLAVCKK